MLEQRIWDGMATHTQVAISEAQQRQAQAKSVQEQIVFRIAESYERVLLNQALIRLARQATNEHKRIVNLIRQRYESGAGRLSDLTLAETRLARFESILLEVTLNEEAAAYNLASLIGKKPQALTSKPIRLVMSTLEEDDLWPMIESHNQEFLAAHKAIEAGRKTIALQRSGYHPRITFNAELDYADSVRGIEAFSRDQRALLRMRWNAFSGGQREASIDAAQAGLVRLQHLRDEIKLS